MTAHPKKQDKTLSAKGWTFAVYCWKAAQTKCTLTRCVELAQPKQTATLQMIDDGYRARNAGSAPATSGSIVAAGAGAEMADALVEAEQNAVQARQEMLLYKGQSETLESENARLKELLAAKEKELQTAEKMRAEIAASQAHAFHEEAVQLARKRAQEEAIRHEQRERELRAETERLQAVARETREQAARAEAEKAALEQQVHTEVRIARTEKAQAEAEKDALQRHAMLELQAARTAKDQAEAEKNAIEQHATAEIHRARAATAETEARLAREVQASREAATAAAAETQHVRRMVGHAEMERQRAIEILERAHEQTVRREEQNRAEMEELQRAKLEMDRKLQEVHQMWLQQHLELTDTQARLKLAQDEGKAAAAAERARWEKEIEGEREQYRQAVEWVHRDRGENP